MMYSEFIEHSNFSEQYISFTEYTTYIEPIYMAADQIPTKQEFITLLEDTFKSLVICIFITAVSGSTEQCRATGFCRCRYFRSTR